MTKILAVNKKALYEYEVLEKIESGIVLTGQEVKSIKQGRANLVGAFVVIKGEQPTLLNAKVPPYQPNNTPLGYEPNQNRRLLLKKQQIKRLIGKDKEKGLTIVPLKMYSKQGKIKVEIAIVKKKSKRDKRETIIKKQLNKDIRRELKER
jgi:SsrA-binding protein